MKLPKIIYVVVAVLLLLLAFFLMRRAVSVSNTSKTSGNAELTKESIADLLTRTDSIQCQYTHTLQAGITSSGTVYVSGGKMNGEFQTMVSGKESTIHVINDGTYSYTWGTDLPQGIKIKSPKVKTELPTSNETTKYVDPNLKYDFQCNPWVVDNKMFTPPQSVAFRDMSAIIEDTQKKVGTMQQSQCAACANLTGETQAQCKKTLNCP